MDFEARQLMPDMVKQADLVLGLTRKHRSAIVELVPSAVRRTFTLRELARLVADVDPAALPGANATTADRLRALVPLAASRRGLVAHRPADDDVVDPYGGGQSLYDTSFGLMVPAIETIVDGRPPLTPTHERGRAPSGPGLRRACVARCRARS